MSVETKTAYEILGGESAVQTLAQRFYDIMDTSPAYAELRAMHGPNLTPVREAFAGFLSGWLGGPRDWFVARGGFCIMSRHRGMGIDETTARQWLEAMREAMDGFVKDAALYLKMDEAFTRLAETMAFNDKAAKAS